MKIYIVGAGLGHERYLTAYASDIIRKANITVTTKRLYDKLNKLNKNMICKDIVDIVQFIERNPHDCICVIVSGDVGFYSFAKSLKARFKDAEIEFVNGINSLQYLTAKLCMPYEDIKTISVHGREADIIPHVCYNNKIFVLTGGKYKASNIIDQLIKTGMGRVIVTIGENLSDVREKIITDTAENFTGQQFDDLSVMLIQNNGFVNHFDNIKDADFIRGKTPMTKQSIRILSICNLDISPNDCIADIGAGTGSVSVMLARKAYKGHVFSIEQDENAISLINQNRTKFCAYNIKIIEGTAPNNMNNLPKIHKAFVGGSNGNMQQIIDFLIEQNNDIKIVVNAITLETLNETLNAFKKHNFIIDINCLNVSNSQSVGRYQMMKAENPIYILTGFKRKITSYNV